LKRRIFSTIKSAIEGLHVIPNYVEVKRDFIYGFADIADMFEGLWRPAKK